MGLTISTAVTLIAALVAISATYNAYLLRGGKLSSSQVLIVFAMVSFIFFEILSLNFLPNPTFIGNSNLSDYLFILGFIFLFAASSKMLTALKSK